MREQGVGCCQVLNHSSGLHFSIRVTFLKVPSFMETAVIAAAIICPTSFQRWTLAPRQPPCRSGLTFVPCQPRPSSPMFAPHCASLARKASPSEPSYRARPFHRHRHSLARICHPVRLGPLPHPLVPPMRGRGQSSQLTESAPPSRLLFRTC